jgi:hypothetical protein
VQGIQSVLSAADLPARLQQLMRELPATGAAAGAGGASAGSSQSQPAGGCWLTQQHRARVWAWVWVCVWVLAWGVSGRHLPGRALAFACACWVWDDDTYIIRNKHLTSTMMSQLLELSDSPAAVLYSGPPGECLLPRQRCVYVGGDCQGCVLV